MAGRRMTDLYVDPSARNGLIKKLEEEKQFRNHEFLLKQKSGDTLWTLCNIKLLKDEDGNYAGTEGLFRDYTDKKALEIERERSERFLDSILDAIQDPVSVHDGELNIRKANQVVRGMFSDREKIEGGKCYEVYYNRNTPCEDCPTLKAFSTKQVHSCMKEVCEEGVVKQYFELFAYPIIDAMGSVESVVEYARNITNLVEREQELQKSNNRFQALFNNTSVMLVIDPETGKIEHANASALNFYGYSYEEITTMRIQDINMLSAEEVKQEMAAAAAAKKTYFNFRHRLASGEIRDVEVYSGKVGWGDKDMLCSVIHDVTEKKQTELELKENEQRTRAILEQAGAGIAVVTVDAEIIEVNDKLSDILGYSKEELLTLNVGDISVPEDMEKEESIISEVLAGKTDYFNIEKRFVHKDGHIVWTNLSSNVVRDEKGEIELVIGVVVDITEQKKAEETLQKALDESEKLKYVVHNSPVCAFTWRNEKGWPVEYVSENVDSLLGYEAEDFISKKIEFRDLIHPEARGRVENEVRNYLNTGKTEYSQEYRMTGKDGSVKWVEEHTSIELDEVDNPVLLHGLVWDITHRKEAELIVEKQRRYEKAVAKVSTTLLTAKSESEALQEALTRLQNVSEVSRIYIFENFNDPDDGLCMRQTYEVCAPDVSPEIDNPALQHVVYNDGFLRWRELLSSGKAVWGNVKDFPSEEWNVLEPQGIVSMLVLPLFIRGEWKGFVGFDETRSSYRWSRNESLLLQTACDLIGGFLGRMESEKTINRQLQEKELLIRETHHRIKNNIASIYGLLHLQAETVENEEARSILNEAVGRVNSMRDLYDKMLSSEDIRIVSVAPYLNDLIYSSIPLFSYQTAVTVEKNLTDFTMDSDKLFLLGIIVNELLTNAMKYAFPGRDTGIIRVGCEKRENHVSLVVQDDGAGLPEGFEIEQSTGLGMNLVHMLSRQLDGTVRFENANGAKVTLEFAV
jgi:PAS domain S-box-containing protein